MTPAATFSFVPWPEDHYVQVCRLSIPELVERILQVCQTPVVHLRDFLQVQHGRLRWLKNSPRRDRRYKSSIASAEVATGCPHEVRSGPVLCCSPDGDLTLGQDLLADVILVRKEAAKQRPRAVAVSTRSKDLDFTVATSPAAILALIQRIRDAEERNETALSYLKAGVAHHEVEAVLAGVAEVEPGQEHYGRAADVN